MINEDNQMKMVNESIWVE